MTIAKKSVNAIHLNFSFSSFSLCLLPCSQSQCNGTTRTCSTCRQRPWNNRHRSLEHSALPTDMAELADKGHRRAARNHVDAVGVRNSSVWRLLRGAAVCHSTPTAASNAWILVLDHLGTNYALLSVGGAFFRGRRAAKTVAASGGHGLQS